MWACGCVFLSSLNANQKNVRMSRPDAAVRSALFLILHTDILEFLRRMTIIIVEGLTLFKAKKQKKKQQQK